MWTRCADELPLIARHQGKGRSRQLTILLSLVLTQATLFSSYPAEQGFSAVQLAKADVVAIVEPDRRFPKSMRLVSGSKGPSPFVLDKVTVVGGVGVRRGEALTVVASPGPREFEKLQKGRSYLLIGNRPKMDVLSFMQFGSCPAMSGTEVAGLVVMPAGNEIAGGMSIGEAIQLAVISGLAKNDAKTNRRAFRFLFYLPSDGAFKSSGATWREQTDFAKAALDVGKHLKPIDRTRLYVFLFSRRFKGTDRPLRDSLLELSQDPKADERLADDDGYLYLGSMEEQYVSGRLPSPLRNRERSDANIIAALNSKSNRLRYFFLGETVFPPSDDVLHKLASLLNTSNQEILRLVIDHLARWAKDPQNATHESVVDGHAVVTDLAAKAAYWRAKLGISPPPA